MITGGCNCGAVRYEINAKPIVVAQCHCKNCQRQSGSAFSVNLLVPEAAVSLKGELTTYTDNDTLSGNPVYRKFCPHCGSPIISAQPSGKGMIIIKAGTLDEPGNFKPAVSVWTSTAWPWVPLPEGQKQFPQNPG